MRQRNILTPRCRGCARIIKSDRVEVNVSVNGSIPVGSDNNDARPGMRDLDPSRAIGPSLHVALWRAADTKRTLELRLPRRGAAFESNPFVRDREYFAAGFAVCRILGKSKTTVIDNER